MAKKRSVNSSKTKVNMAVRKNKKSKVSAQRIRKSKDMPATQGQLDATRGELKSEITNVRLEMSAGFKSIDARFDKMEGRFKSIDARFDKMEGRFKSVDARFDKMEGRFKSIDARFDKVDARFAITDAKHDRMLALLEEQRRDTKFSMDAIRHMMEKQEALSHRTRRLEKTTYGIEGE